ncbi:DUF3137 domain-containing protein [Denitrobaculum tricleocarpae]|uniref:DUF3137 domain-containing protein n=1 Tax=Denitrobaculum tricleocarpae TaxID=2591009 RepID=A0A545TKL8_9PROT|nr:DUF3137 domain-containing protein [Denitrobaculum tricleocarpae]TQV77769.1 DUF3137 domain-containing protein [Denitrobaculum tricleocarpae]
MKSDGGNMHLPSTARTGSLLDRFETVFEEKIAPGLEARDHERIALAQKKRRNWTLVLAEGAAAALVAFLITHSVDALLLAVPTSAVSYWLRIARPVKRFTDSVRQDVFVPLCDALGFTYQLQPNGSDVGYFQKLGLAGSCNHRRFEGEVSGRYKGLNFSLLGAHLRYRGIESMQTVFHGLLVSFDMSKSFHGRTLVLRDGGLVGNFLGHGGNKLERVRLEDLEFERAHEVYSNDEIEARDLLPRAFTDRLLELEEQLAAKVRLAFDRNSLLMSIDRNRDAFSIGGLDAPLADKKRLREFVIDLTMIFDVVETLRLNAETKL